MIKAKELNPFDTDQNKGLDPKFVDFVEVVNGHYVYQHKMEGYFVMCPSDPWLYNSGYFVNVAAALVFAESINPPSSTLTLKKRSFRR